jgi:hypothetical protein
MNRKREGNGDMGRFAVQVELANFRDQAVDARAQKLRPRDPRFIIAELE